MSSTDRLNVYSDIGKLKTVLVHKPGHEIENLTPDLLDRLLFDDIPFLEVAVEEHNAFTNIMRDKGVEVLYLEELMAETIEKTNVKEKFIEEFVKEAGIFGHLKKDVLIKYLSDIKNNKELVLKTMEGIEKSELDCYEITLTDSVDSHYPFAVDPMPNLYFTRDPFAVIGNGISLNHMRTVTRNRETLFGKYIFKYHKRFKGKEPPIWYNRDDITSLEGGDELILSKELLGIGISERTDAASIEKLAKKVFTSDTSFNTILAFNIPKKRAFMHLDTVFTMVDYDKFVVHPEIEGPLTTYSIKKTDGEKITIEEETMELDKILSKHLHLDKVTLIRCGGNNSISAAREQWSDGSNALAIAPGEVIVYSRNHITNKLLADSGVKVYTMPSSELSRGRGGPRCMSMPFYREDI